MKSKFLLPLITGCFVISALMFTLNSCSKSKADDGANRPPYYDLDVKLFSVSAGHPNNASGYIEFRQDPDTTRLITLKISVSKLEPNHSYSLQRAVNPITDSSCTSTAWLTLGLGLTPQTINTDSNGDGNANLFRDITSIARGTQFRIHFQVVDAITSGIVLSSDCYQYTVR